MKMAFKKMMASKNFELSNSQTMGIFDGWMSRDGSAGKRLGSVGFFTPRNTPFISRWNNLLILTIDPNFLGHPRKWSSILFAQGADGGYFGVILGDCFAIVRGLLGNSFLHKYVLPKKMVVCSMMICLCRGTIRKQSTQKNPRKIQENTGPCLFRRVKTLGSVKGGKSPFVQ